MIDDHLIEVFDVSPIHGYRIDIETMYHFYCAWIKISDLQVELYV